MTHRCEEDSSLPQVDLLCERNDAAITLDQLA